jgi:ribulose 1,5-bisphosphate synthetase/thiazole synthase
MYAMMLSASPRQCTQRLYRGRRIVNLIEADIAIVGAGGAGLRAAIAAAEQTPGLRSR